MDYTESALPKVNKHVQTKAMRDALRKRIDRIESAKVKERSEGQCEVYIHFKSLPNNQAVYVRCGGHAMHTHHMVSGIGVRARGKSLLAEHKQHVCVACHSDIHDKKLQRVGGEAPHWADSYVRVK